MGGEGCWHPELVTAKTMRSGAAAAVLALWVCGCTAGSSAGVPAPSPDQTESVRLALNSSELGMCLTQHGFPTLGAGFYDTRTDLTEGPDYEWVGGVSAADGSGHELTLTYTIADGAFALDEMPYWDDEKAAVDACRHASGAPATPIPSP